MYGFGSMLRDYLEFYKISQTEFAERLGVSTKHVNKIINDQADISIELMLAISLITDSIIFPIMVIIDTLFATF